MSWPPFLDLLDQEPKKAIEQFSRETVEFLKNHPPNPLRDLDRDERHEVIQDVVIYCIENDGRVLRTYSDCGRPFRSWLYTLASHRAIDYLRRRQMEKKYHTAMVDDPPDPPDNVKTGSASPEHDTAISEAMEAVGKALLNLGKKCRLLIEMWVDGFTPLEMVLELGLPRDQNAKVSNDLRYCRKKLAENMIGMGFDISDWN